VNGSVGRRVKRLVSLPQRLRSKLWVHPSFLRRLRNTLAPIWHGIQFLKVRAPRFHCLLHHRALLARLRENNRLAPTIRNRRAVQRLYCIRTDLRPEQRAGWRHSRRVCRRGRIGASG